MDLNDIGAVHRGQVIHATFASGYMLNLTLDSNARVAGRETVPIQRRNRRLTRA